MTGYVLLWTNVIAASVSRQQQLSDPSLCDRITFLKTDSFGFYLKFLQLTLVAEGCKPKRLRAAVRRHTEREEAAFLVIFETALKLIKRRNFQDFLFKSLLQIHNNRKETKVCPGKNWLKGKK